MKHVGLKHKTYTSSSVWAFVLVLGLPIFALYVFFCIMPMFTSVKYGFFTVDYMDLAKKTFAGIGNYKAIFADKMFWVALKNDALIVLGKELIIVVFSIFFAVSLTRFRLKNSEVAFYRFVLYIPNILSVIIIAEYWSRVFTAEYGLLAVITGIKDVNWMDKNPIGITVVVAGWCGIGYFMIVLISAINNVSKEMYEAAEVDGAGPVQQLFKITLPQVKNQIIFMVINIISTSLAGNMNLVLPLFGNKPDSYVMGTYVYYTQSTVDGLGKANAAAVVLMIISFVVCGTFNVVTDKISKAGDKS